MMPASPTIPPGARRAIIHLDLDAFFCAVEMQRDPSLVGKPFAVGGRPEQRGVVASCSYPARKFGVRSAMPMARALAQCPGLKVVPPNFRAYREASDRVMHRLRTVTERLEQISIDEAFMDVTGLGAEAIARRLQAEINSALGLPCSLGVASSKLVAKIANNIGKSGARGDAPPNALTIIPPGEEAAFLAPLPVEALWGVGPKTAERLHGMGIATIGALAARSEAEMVQIFGRTGADLWRHACGIDARPVVTEHETKSVSKETTFAQDVRDAETLKRTLRKLADGVGWRLRKSGFTGTTVRLKLRWTDFTTVTRQTTFTHPVDSDDAIYAAALALFDETWMPGRAVRLVGVGVSGLEDSGRQMALWDDPQQRKLQTVLDELRGRFGESAVQRGTDLMDED